jgi:hypothetical protein
LGNEVVGPRFDLGWLAISALWSRVLGSQPARVSSLRSDRLDGRSDRELTHRFMGSTVGRHAQLLLFDQQELRRDVGLYSDLYVFDLRSGQNAGPHA